MDSAYHTVILILGCLKLDFNEAMGNSLVYSTWATTDTLGSISNYSDVTPDEKFISFISPPRISGITSDPKKGTLYLYAAADRVIYRLSNFSGSVNMSQRLSIRREGVSSALASITFDWLSENLYWTDSQYDWIAMMPAESSDETMYKVLVHADLQRPEGLALDPEAGYMFWSDTSETYRIERADLAGRGRMVLVHKAMSRVLAMTVDSNGQTLYWIDNVRQTIESCDYFGNNRRVLNRRNGVSMKSIDVDGNNLYVTSDEAILAVDKVSGLSQRTYAANRGYFAIHVYRTARQTSSNPCESSNCNHMCANTPQGSVCLCKEGFELSTDGRSCTSKTLFYERGIVFTDGTEICVLPVDGITGFLRRFECKNMTSVRVGAITADKTNAIYHDTADNSIKSFPFANPTSSRTILNSVTSVKRMVFDWIDNILIWIDQSQSSIKAHDIESPATTAQLYGNLVQPDYLALDPYNKSIFWIEGPSGSREIKHGAMSGSQTTPFTTLVDSAGLSSPIGLFYDYIKNRLFFVDGGVLKSVLTSGTDLKTYGAVGSGTELAVYKDYAILSDSSTTLYSKILDASRTPSSLTLSRINSIQQIMIHDPNMMTDTQGVCTLMNGGCEHICLPASGGHTCRCEHGYSLQLDNRTCSGSILEQDFAIVTDYTHDKIYQISLDGQTVSALDIPDLENSNCAVINPSDKMVYLSETSSRQIKSISIYGTNTSTVYTPGMIAPDRLAIDQSTGSLYYTGVSILEGIVPSVIGVVKLDTLVHKTVVSDLQTPRAIALYPSKGLIFWTDFGNSSHIGRASMDGSSKTTIASSNMRWPNGLAIDYQTDRLYWTDGFYNRIESCDLLGGNRQTLLTDSNAHMVDIIIKGSFIYYTAWNRQKVMKADKSTGSLVSWMEESPEFGRLDSIDFYPGETQPVSSLCQTRNGECSTFCFPAPSGRVCGCQDGVSLNADGRTCIDVTQCPASIQNGQLSSSCLRYTNERCNFTCNNGYRHKAGIDNIQCGQLGRWNEDTDTICEAIKCERTFPTGNISPACNPVVGSQCAYECKAGYTKRNDVTFVTCLSSGNWDRNVTGLCTADHVDRKCELDVPNGQLSQGCNGSVGTQCSFTCNVGYSKKNGVSAVTCLASGQWNHDTNTLCANVRCSDAISDGSLESSCMSEYGSQCSYECREGYGKKDEKVSTLTCLSSGQWDHDPEKLCIIKPDNNATESRALEKDKGNEGSNVGAMAGGVVAGVAVVVVIVVLVFIVIRRRSTESPYERKLFHRDSSANEFQRNPAYEDMETVYDTIRDENITESQSAQVARENAVSTSVQGNVNLGDTTNIKHIYDT